MADSNLKEIPNDLLLGFASSAYQIEGAWNADGKGETIWDRFIHKEPSRIADRSSGDEAADSYHQFKEDISVIKQMGGQVYRFSISWSRILPEGFANKVNQAGLNYYNNLINELIANRIEPIITLYHWDLPQPLQDIGGWPNEHLITYFEDYAKVAFSNFGDRVKKWITFNEPLETALFGYGFGFFAPGVKRPGIADYLAGHTILKAHARVYHLYQDVFKREQKGVVGITLTTNWFEPKTESSEDMEAARKQFQFSVGWFAHPIFSKAGDYPDEVKNAIARVSSEEGFPKSRLPEFDDFWKAYIRGSSDFYGLNHYTTSLVTFKDRSSDPTSWEKDAGIELSHDHDWPKTASVWQRIFPGGFRKALVLVKEEYGNPPIYVTENGVSDRGEMDDYCRVSYFNDYIGEMLKAIHLDGVRVNVYTAWSLIDSFEWLSGYTEKFGVVSVDFDDSQRKRTIKKSGKFLMQIYKERKLGQSNNSSS